MGLFSGFKKHVALTIAKDDYEKCHRHHNQERVGFRSKLISEYTSKYPDSVFLYNALSPVFMIWSKAQSTLYAGQFADPYQSYLDFVPFDASAEDYERAVSSYRQSVRQSQGVICPDGLDKFKAAGSRHLLSQRVMDSFQKDGFAVVAEAPKAYLYGASLFLNDQKIAMSTHSDQKPAGYFLNQLSEHVLCRRNHSGRGVSHLFLAVVSVNPIFETKKFHYHLTFDDRLDYTSATSDNRHKKPLDNLLNFLIATEGLYIHKTADEESGQFDLAPDAELNDPRPSQNDSPVDKVYVF